MFIKRTNQSSELTIEVLNVERIDNSLNCLRTDGVVVKLDIGPEDNFYVLGEDGRTVDTIRYRSYRPAAVSSLIDYERVVFGSDDTSYAVVRRAVLRDDGAISTVVGVSGQKLAGLPFPSNGTVSIVLDDRSVGMLAEALLGGCFASSRSTGGGSSAPASPPAA